MSKEIISKYNPNYPYDKPSITTQMSSEGYPIIERTNNGLLFPEGPKDEVDIKDFKQQE